MNLTRVFVDSRLLIILPDYRKNHCGNYGERCGNYGDLTNSLRLDGMTPDALYLSSGTNNYFLELSMICESKTARRVLTFVPGGYSTRAIPKIALS